MPNNPDAGLTPSESGNLRFIAEIMIPASAEFGVPGADDPLIFADIERSIGRDLPTVKVVLAALMAEGLDAADRSRSETVAQAFLSRGGVAASTLSRVILQCYYRDDRVVRSLGLEPRAPYPRGHTVEQGDWSLLDPVRARPKMWRDAS